jgi:exodeoxyribonuclease VII small subunit
MNKKQISYNEALEELEEILEDIQDQKVDVDNLAAKVKQARELINICEQRIKKAEMEVERIKDSLKPEINKKEK